MSRLAHHLTAMTARRIRSAGVVRLAHHYRCMAVRALRPEPMSLEQLENLMIAGTAARLANAR
jgi:hypothetical protein